MVVTLESTCRLLIADRAFHGYGLAHALRQAGFRLVDIADEQRTLLEFGLLEMDALLEIEWQADLGAFFPAAFQLSAWRATVCTQGLTGRPALILTRTEGQDPAIAQASYQEIVTMLQTSMCKGISRSTAPLPSVSAAETLSDTPLPCPLAQETLAPQPRNRLASWSADPALTSLAAAPTGLAHCASALAHDLNNFLTIIRGNCHLLCAERTPCDPARPLIEEILQASEQACLLVSQLDALAHLDAPPSARPDSTVKDLCRAVESASGILQGVLAAKHDIVYQLDTGPCPVRLAPGELERILLNLGVNAHDAMPDGGTLTVACTQLPPQAPRPRRCAAGPLVLLTISDTGQGMDESMKPRVLQPGVTTKPGGKGLGLSIVNNLVAQQGGHMEIASEPGRGTSIQIYLPLEEGDSNGSRAAVPAKPTVLLVEDEPMVRSIFRRTLQGEYNIVEASNGLEALRLAEEIPCAIDVLITDVAMPRMQGPELAARLQDIHPEAKVLYLSGFPEIPQTGDRRQVANFLQKPFKPETLLQKVRELVGTRTSRTPTSRKP